MNERSIVESPAQSGPRPDASREEKIEFLKLTMQTSEGQLARYDTKAQIAIAAFVLSWTPLWTILHSSCDRAATTDPVIVLLLFIIATIVTFGYVIWPVNLKEGAVVASMKLGLFFLVHRFKGGAAEYMKNLDDLVTEEELANEAIKLSYIRDVKGRRFKRGLFLTVAAYMVYVGCFLLLRNCASQGL